MFGHTGLVNVLVECDALRQLTPNLFIGLFYILIVTKDFSRINCRPISSGNEFNTAVKVVRYDKGFNTNQIEAEDVDGKFLGEYGRYYQGDIRLVPGMLDDIKSGLINEEYRWPNADVIYTLVGGFTRSQLDTIFSAMDEIQSNTCIRFFEYDPQIDGTNNPNILQIQRERSGCWSYVGCIGGTQELNIEDGCIHNGIVMHELIHAIGFFHEQSRSDRDEFVQILWNNIADNMEGNFDKYTTEDVSPFGVSYGYESLMHYGKFAFSKNGQPTIEPKDPSASIGQRERLTDGDKCKINNMYAKLYPFCQSCSNDESASGSDGSPVSGAVVNSSHPRPNRPARRSGTSVRFRARV